MPKRLSDEMLRTVEAVVRDRMGADVTLDINAVAEEVRVVFADRNVPCEDIAASVAQFAAQCGYPVEFAALAPQAD
ncbi:MAG: hypothetical protein DI527_19940 [Chelatococcus sp.]|nr:MAG: hypothetical protein DI527_19940 [Chelatococcus sp.]